MIMLQSARVREWEFYFGWHLNIYWNHLKILFCVVDQSSDYFYLTLNDANISWNCIQIKHVFSQYLPDNLCNLNGVSFDFKAVVTFNKTNRQKKISNLSQNLSQIGLFHSHIELICNLSTLFLQYKIDFGKC